MKNIILLIVSFASVEFAFSQIRTEAVDFSYNLAYCVGTQSSTAWIGEEIVVMIEGETAADRDAAVMVQVLQILEDVISKFEELTGLENLPSLSQHDGKPVIEVVKDNCGAGGLAHHGRLGMSTGAPLFDQYYGLIEQGIIAIPQVFLYELNRNFWLAGSEGFNGKFDWAMNDEVQNYGWWTVGMNNAMGYIIPKELDIQVHYFGTTGLDFWKDGMIGDFTPYLNDTTYDFDYGWRQSLMPWRPVQSINNLMTGFILYSYENFGGTEWLKNFYTHIQSAEIPNRSDVFAYQECRDNIYKIWSLSAEQDLLGFFEDSLRWVITPEAQQFVEEKFSLTPIKSGIEAPRIRIYPNPAQEFLTIEAKDAPPQSVRLVNSRGQILDFREFAGRLHLPVGHLGAGLYWIQVEAAIFPILIQ
ncbi:MAG: T9SS type A sorting domain-containing protein [Bacteroidota bacterium]